MNQLMRRCAVVLAACLILTCGVLAYAEVIPQGIQDEEQVESVMDVQDEDQIEPIMDVQDEEPVVDEATVDEEYTESKVVFTDDGMLILPRPVKGEKIFIEWNTKEDGTGQGYKAGEIVDPENIELYAIWADAEVLADKATISEATVVEAVYDEEYPETPDSEMQTEEETISEATVVEATYDEELVDGEIEE